MIKKSIVFAAFDEEYVQRLSLSLQSLQRNGQALNL